MFIAWLRRRTSKGVCIRPVLCTSAREAGKPRRTPITQVGPTIYLSDIHDPVFLVRFWLGVTQFRAQIQHGQVINEHLAFVVLEQWDEYVVPSLQKKVRQPSPNEWYQETGRQECPEWGTHASSDDLDASMLGVTLPTSAGKLKAAYRLAAFASHPDRGGSHEKFLKIQEAYERLMKKEIEDVK